jgi:uncharacterized protein (TIGR03067 family)
MKTSLLTLICLLPAMVAWADEQSVELTTLEGTWKVVQLEARGKEVEPAPGAPDRVALKTGTATFYSQGRELPAFRRLLMVAEARPNTLSFIRDSLELLPCLSEVTNDEWKLAMPMVPKPRGREVLTRPESFDSTDKPVAVLTMTRAKP